MVTVTCSHSAAVLARLRPFILTLFLPVFLCGGRPPLAASLLGRGRLRGRRIGVGGGRAPSCEYGGCHFQ